MSDTLLSLSTQVEPAGRFEVDGEEYLLLSNDSFSAEQESEAIAAFKRYIRLSEKLEKASNDKEVKALSLELRACRVEVLTLYTNMPPKVAESLGLRSQTILMREIGKMNKADSDAMSDDEKDADGGGGSE